MTVINSLLKLDAMVGALDPKDMDLKPGGLVYVHHHSVVMPPVPVLARGEMVAVGEMLKEMSEASWRGLARILGEEYLQACADAVKKTCISCGSKTDMAGNLPCGH